MNLKGKAVSELEMVVSSEGKVKEGEETEEGKTGEEVKGNIPRTVLENQSENREPLWQTRLVFRYLYGQT